jgi:predicted transposase YdaD
MSVPPAIIHAYAEWAPPTGRRGRGLLSPAGDGLSLSPDGGSRGGDVLALVSVRGGAGPLRALGLRRMSGPHDLLVRYTLSHPEHAAAELRAALPAYVAAQVDWSTLEREPGSVVDLELRETETDLLFSARLRGGQPVLLYVLVEHQSSVDRWMPLRMLRYVVRQLEQWRQQHPDSQRLPLVIPLVLYHGPEGAWSAPRCVEELFEVPGEQPELWRALGPRLEFLLDDLTAEREEALLARPGPPPVRLLWRVLRYGSTRELAQRLWEWEEVFIQVAAGDDSQEKLGPFVHYLRLVRDEAALAGLMAMLRSELGAQRVEDLMRWEDLFIEKGHQKGRAEGRAEGLAEGQAKSVLRILAARRVHVDDAARQRILSCTDLATLDQWLERALTATRLSDVLRDTVQ